MVVLERPIENYAGVKYMYIQCATSELFREMFLENHCYGRIRTILKAVKFIKKLSIT